MATITITNSRTFKLLSALTALVFVVGVASLVHSGGKSSTSAHVLGEQIYAAKPNGNTSPNSSAPTTNPSAKFDAAGDVEGLYPGGTKPLSLTLTNNTGAAISVTSLSVDVADASAGCAASNLRIGSFNGPVTVPKKGTATTVIQVTMIDSAPNACQGVTFPLSYSGDASPA